MFYVGGTDGEFISDGVITGVCFQGLPVVMDADGIAVIEHMLHGESKEPFRDVSAAVFTPNAPEFWRLCDACGIQHGKVQPHDDSALVQVCCKCAGFFFQMDCCRCCARFR